MKKKNIVLSIISAKDTENYSSEGDFNNYIENDCSEEYSDKNIESYSTEDSFHNVEDKKCSEDYFDGHTEDYISKHIEENCSEDPFEEHVQEECSDNYFCKSEDNNYAQTNNIKNSYNHKHLDSNKYSRCTENYNKYALKENNGLEEEFITKSCEANVTSKVLSFCPSTSQIPETTLGPVIIKVPVVLSEFQVTISTISSIKLEDPTLEIKQIKKNVYLTECELIPNSGGDNPDIGVLFISGFVRKNIEYISKECSDKNILCGKIKHITVKVPFSCTTKVTFITRPIFISNTSQDEVEIFQDTIKTYAPCEENILSHSTCVQSFRFTEVFNEKTFYELVKVEIVESDTLENPLKVDCSTAIDQEFQNLTEKVVMNLTIKLLQNQQVSIISAPLP